MQWQFFSAKSFLTETKSSSSLLAPLCFLCLLFLTPLHGRPSQELTSQRRAPHVKEQRSNEDVLESTVFIVGVSAGIFGFVAISCAICLCVFLIGRHGAPHTLSLKASQRKREIPVLVATSRPRNNQEDGVEEEMQKDTPQEHSFRTERVSFVRTSVSKDTSFQALENLELEKIVIGPCLGRGAYGKVYKGEYAGIQLAVKVCDHDGGFLRNGNEPLETYLSRNIHHDNVVKTLVNETRRCTSLHASTISATPLVNPFPISPPEWSLPRSTTPSIEPKISVTSTMGDNKEDLQASDRADDDDDDDEFSYFARALETPSGDDAYRTWIIMEYCEMGSLDQAIKERMFFGATSEHRDRPNIHFMILSALDIADAMKYLHEQCIVHGDLKSQNVLLKKSILDVRGFYCKVGDFGLSRVMANKTHIDTFTCGTVSHSAPELFRHGLLTPAADVYSFGILLWELVTGTKAFSGAQHNGIVMAVTSGYRPIIPSYCPPYLSLLINECWQDSHSDRPTFKTILAKLRMIIQDETSFLPCQHVATTRQLTSLLPLPSLEAATAATAATRMTQTEATIIQDSTHHATTATSQSSSRGLHARPHQVSDDPTKQSLHGTENLRERRISAILRRTGWRSENDSSSESLKSSRIPDEQWHSASKVIVRSNRSSSRDACSSNGSPACVNQTLEYTLPP